MNVLRGISSEGSGRIAYHTNIRGLMDTDRGLRGFLEGETDRLPALYRTGSGATSARCSSTSRPTRSSRPQRVPEEPGRPVRHPSSTAPAAAARRLSP